MKSYYFLLILLITSCSSRNSFIHRNPAQVLQEASLLSYWEPARESYWEEFNPLSITGLYNNADYPIAYDLIKQAVRSIDIEIYEMKDPTFKSLIIKALEKGVSVNIVKDSNTIGDSCNELAPEEQEDGADCKDEKAYIQLIMSKGAKYTFFDKKQLCGITGRSCFQHGKMIIVDDRYLLLSSGNFNSSSFCASTASKCNRDYSYVTKNRRIIRDLKQVFQQDLKGEKWDFKPLIESLHPSLTVSPFSQERIISFIKSAYESIWIQNQYLEDRAVNQALIEKALEGVQINIQVADYCAFGIPSAAKKQKILDIYKRFSDAGIHAKTFTDKIRVGGKKGYLHSKAIVIDEKFAWVGSINGPETSSLQNREFGIIFDSRKSVKLLLDIMRNDFDDKNALPWEENLKCAFK